jgi:hypothetical protein
MESGILFIGAGILALVALVARFHPRWRGTTNWREVVTGPKKDVRDSIRRTTAVISNYTNNYRKLSLIARTAVALVCFERYCQTKGLRHPMIDAFLNQMWELPCIKSLPDWESHNCELVHFALGDPLPREMLEALNSAGISEGEFRQLVENCVEIFYCSAYAASDNAGSLQALDQVLCVTSNVGVTPPPVQPFLLSLFDDAHGWGKKLSPDQRDGWRFRAYDHPPA